MLNALAALPDQQRNGRAGLPSRAEIHARIAPFAKANSLLGYTAFGIDVAIYAAGIACVVLLDNLLLQIAGGILAGSGLVNLGSISHEAAHRSVVRSRGGNKAIAVVSLTMILFNYRLWVYDHHVLHHGKTNVKHNNFLSPLTLAEFRALPTWRRALYRAYHMPGGLGILLYFLLERWPTVHFYPGSWLPQKFQGSARGYAALMVVWTVALLAVLVAVPQARGASVLPAVICGFVVPYLFWFTVFSMTAFLQHTNPNLRWYRSVSGIESPPESLSVHVGVWGWINHLTHYVLEHPVHHISAMIPHYHLKKAQAALADLVPPAIISMPFTLGNMNMVLRRCRLYDYEEHAWTDFDGSVTAIPLDYAALRGKPAPAAGADLPPYAAGGEGPGVFFPADGTKEAAEAADAKPAAASENARA